MTILHHIPIGPAFEAGGAGTIPVASKSIFSAIEMETIACL